MGKSKRDQRHFRIHSRYWLVRKRGEETLVGLFNFTEYPAGASLDALGGKYHTPEGTSVWLADVELEPYQALLVKNK